MFFVVLGGEIVCVMLFIKVMIVGVVKFFIIVFDEIDIGVFGEIVDCMVDIM